MEAKWDELFLLLTEKKYPEGFTKVQKMSLRKYSKKFSVNDGELFYQNRRAIKSKEEAWRLFEEFHSTPIGGHTGIIKTRHAMCSRFYWHGMTVHIDIWVSECDKCQRERKPLAAVLPLQNIKASAVWELLGIDLTGPFPKTPDGYQYIFTATDYFSKWVEAFPLKTKSAAEVGQRMCSIIYRHGCPKRILSDQGREFVNELNNTLCDLLGIERSVTAAYHPQTNGLDKKTNHNIKRALMKLVNEKQNNWDTFLDATLFSLRAKVHISTKHTPFQLMYGREAVFPSEVPVDLPFSIVLPNEEDINEFSKKRKEEISLKHSSAQNNMAEAQNKKKK